MSTIISSMFAKAALTDEERAVDPQLGFPRGYAKLCRHAHIQAQGLISPFTEGPPRCFHPYAVQDEEIVKLKGYDDLFPILEDGQRDVINDVKKHIDFLWQQLDHMGNAGIDPAMFRVDVYGNVLYRDADLGSPLAWEVDHWFPQARGGKTVPGNLRLVQWQACQRKGKKLEFLVPWWDLQLGISVNQFLSVFASKNASFRHRAFSFFFLSGENEQLNNSKVVQGHSWPRHFRERKNQVGLAPAALVQVHKASDGALHSLNNNNRAINQEYLPVSSAGNCEEFGTRDWQNLDIEYQKDSRVKHPRKGGFLLDKENEGFATDKDFTNSLVPLQRGQRWKQLMEKEKRQKLEESMRLEEELQLMKAKNIKEKAVLEQLEHDLAKQKKRVEKQRRWSETQSQYRLCLEKMIRDTLHQCVVYKEQARLNQAACNALLARLESQKSTCDVAEEELVRKVKQREELEASVRPQITKRGRHQGHTDVGSCLKPSAIVNLEPLHNTSTSCDPAGVIASSHMHSSSWRQQCGRTGMREALPDHVNLGKQDRRMNSPKLHVRDKYATQASAYQLEEYKMDVHGQECIGQHAEEMDEGSEIALAQGIPEADRKALEATDELDVVLLGYEYQENEAENVNREESVGDNGTTHHSVSRNYSDDDEDDAGNDHTYHGNDAYAESNNGDHNLEKHDYLDDVCDQSRNVGDHLQNENQRPEARKLGEAEDAVLKQCNGGESDEQVDPAITKKTKDEQQLDELLQEVLAMQDRVNEAMVDAIQEEQDEERVKRVGKLNLDKWLQKLLLDSAYGQGQESLSSFPYGINYGSKQVESLAWKCRGLSKKDKGSDPTTEKEIGDCKMAQKELVMAAATERRVGGVLLKESGFKNGDVLGSAETEDPKLVSSSGRTDGILKESKKSEWRTSPWRWVSPVPKRSTSVGSETRIRRLSPWRRSSKEEKAEERKMLEDFSKLRMGAERQQGGGIPSNAAPIGTEEFDTSVKARERSASAKLKSRVKVLPQGIRERSISTPPAKSQHGSKLALSPLPRRSHDAMMNKTGKFAKHARHHKDDYTVVDRGRGGDGVGADNGAANASVNGGASRKANMLKKSATMRSGNVDIVATSEKVDDAALALGKAGGRVVFFKEDNQGHKGGSLFEDLDPQDGLRASISLAWKKAVKKFELGRLQSLPSAAP